MAFFKPGDPVPFFRCPSPGNPKYDFSTVAGRYVVLSFLGTARVEPHQIILSQIRQLDKIFNDRFASFFVVSMDPEDEKSGRIEQRIPGFRVFWDFNARISRVYGACADSSEAGRRITPVTYILNYGLQVLRTIPVTNPANHVGDILEALKGLPDPAEINSQAPWAPVLLIPNVLEPDLCRAFIDHYEEQGGSESGFMRENAEGKTIGVVDYSHKRRSDCLIAQPELRDALNRAVTNRIAPQIRKAFQFNATRIERYIIACYNAGEGGYFRPHRDNTTKGTAHRRFAVTINLNADEYDGGELRFPEFGPRTYRAPTGGAVVFSCSLLHEATPVTRGKRYCTLPFLYDDAAAKIRVENIDALGDDELRESLRQKFAQETMPPAPTPQ